MRFAHILSRVTSSPWFISPEALGSIMSVLEARINIRAEGPPTPPLDSEHRPANTGPAMVKTGKSVAILPVYGILAPRLDPMEAMCGGCDTEVLRENFDAANADPAIDAIVMRFDSPGGLAMGTHELFTHLYGSKQKPLYAFTDALLGSAAYYLASACDSIVCTPTSQVGGIGTIATVRVNTGKDGTQLFVFKSGKFKDLGTSARPPTDEESAIIQGQIDRMGGWFRSDLQQARPSISPDAMEGLAYFGADAPGLGLADSVVNDFATFLASLT